MRKFLVISIPIVTIVFFVFLMQSGNFLKQPFGNEEGVPAKLEQMIQEVQKENWDSALNHWDGLARDWDKVVKRVQFSAERNEINDFTVSIARLRGAIEAQDKSSGLQLLYEAYEHWEDLGQ